MQRILLISLLSSFLIPAIAQDRFFTQFYAAPLEINPALAGSIDGSYRVSILYHDQWHGLIDNPYQTYGVFGDLRFETGKKSKDFAGAGISVVADRNGIFNFNTNQITISGAYHKFLSSQTDQYLSAGAYIGIVQRSVNYEGLIFDDQFNGLDQYNFGTQEDLPENNLAHADFGIGLNYAVETSDVLRITGGASLAHIASPSISFFKRTEGQEDSPDIQLKRRLTGYVNLDFAINESVNLLPRFAIYSQGTAMMLQGGSHVRFSINKYNNNALHLGAGLRLTEEEERLTPSSVMALTGIELGSFLMGFSYEYSLDDLSSDRLGQGIFEFSITFIGEYENDDAFCPKF